MSFANQTDQARRWWWSLLLSSKCRREILAPGMAVIISLLKICGANQVPYNAPKRETTPKFQSFRISVFQIVAWPARTFVISIFYAFTNSQRFRDCLKDKVASRKLLMGPDMSFVGVMWSGLHTHEAGTGIELQMKQPYMMLTIPPKYAELEHVFVAQKGRSGKDDNIKIYHKSEKSHFNKIYCKSVHSEDAGMQTKL